VRFSSRSLFLAVALGGTCALYAAPLGAQSTTASTEVTPPKLQHAPPLELPAGQTPSEAVSVELELDIDDTGAVTAAKVVSAPNEPFDAKALAAAREFRFEPARRGDVPLAVRVGYRYVFPAAAPPPPALPLPIPSATGPAVPAAPPAPPAAQAPPPPEVEEYEATAEIDAPPREAVKRTVGEAELTKIPGTRGDALRAIEVLPGVARTGVDDGTPVLRGAGGDESQAFLNGMPVPFLYHFGGVTSFFSSRLLSRVDLYPGNFSPRFGRAVGGVIDVRTRDPRRDGFHGALDVSLIDTSLFAETPLGENTGLAIAGRRSNIDLVYSSLVPEDVFDVVAAPTYYDYQGILSQRLGRKHKLRVLGYGSRDSVKLVFSEPLDEDPGLTGSVGGTLSFHRLQAELYSTFSPAVTQELTVAFGRLDAETRFGELFQTYGGEELHARGEWSFELGPSVRLTAGADLFSWFLTGEYRGPAPTQYEGNPRDNDPLAAQRIVSVSQGGLNFVRPGAYVELGWRPVPSLLLSPGLRADYYSEFEASTLDPRLSARYELSERTAFKAGFGRFSQAPQFWQSIEGIGNPNLEPYGAWQSSLGVEQNFGKSLKFGVEGFYKAIDNVVVGTENAEPPAFVNDGKGRIYGAEFSLEARPDDRTFAYLAYTLSRSERSEHGRAYRLFDNDQTHILSLVASRQLGKGWELGTRFRLVSGEPTTPVVGTVFDARSGVYLPTYGKVNSERNPMFHQLDVKLEKQFKIGSSFILAPYLDVQNVYNSKNVEGADYNYDYTKKEEANGLGLFPNLGIRGEL
jgi:TonB family protein